MLTTSWVMAIRCEINVSSMGSVICACDGTTLSKGMEKYVCSRRSKRAMHPDECMTTMSKHWHTSEDETACRQQSGLGTWLLSACCPIFGCNLVCQRNLRWLSGHLSSEASRWWVRGHGCMLLDIDHRWISNKSILLCLPSTIPFPSSSLSYFCHISNTPPFIPVLLVSSFIPMFPVSLVSIPMSPWSSRLSHIVSLHHSCLSLFHASTFCS